MSQAEIDAFVNSAYDGTLTPEGVTAAVVTRGIPVNGRHSRCSATALHCAVWRKRRELVVALLAAGADANVEKRFVGGTSLWWGACKTTAGILQLLIDSGGSVNEPDDFGETPLMVLVRHNNGDAAARLALLLARPELELDAEWKGKTAEQWAKERGYPKLAAAIAEKQRTRRRWSDLRSVWVAATVTPSI
jgi:ankyrin repeat protein